MQACSQILNSATQAQSKRLRRRLQPSEMESGSTVLYQSAVMGSRKGQRLETRGRFPFPRRYEKAVLKKERKRKKTYIKGCYLMGYNWGLLADILLPALHLVADAWQWGCREPGAIPTSRPHPQPGAAPPAALEGPVSSRTFIHYHIHSVFISQMYRSVTMEKKENSEFILKRYSN